MSGWVSVTGIHSRGTLVSACNLPRSAPSAARCPDRFSRPREQPGDVLQAALHVVRGAFPRPRIGGRDGGVLLEDVPAVVAGCLERPHRRGDRCVTVPEWPEHARLDRGHQADLPVPKTCAQCSVDVFQVDVSHPVGCCLRELHTVGLTEREMPGVEAEERLAALERPPDVVPPLHERAPVRVHDVGQLALGGNLVDAREPVEDPAPVVT